MLRIIIILFTLVSINISSLAAMNQDDLSKAKKLFIDQCSKCHRKDGKGIIGVYPPIKNADYIKNNEISELLRGMLFGRSGKLKVNGVVYNGVMITEIDNNVSDENSAILLNYILQNLNNINKTVTAKDVKAARKAGKLQPHK